MATLGTQGSGLGIRPFDSPLSRLAQGNPGVDFRRDWERR